MIICKISGPEELLVKRRGFSATFFLTMKRMLEGGKTLAFSDNLVLGEI